MSRRVLHVLAQRPGFTGSGVTAEALIREAAPAGWEQHVLAGVPADAPPAAIGGLLASHFHLVRFAPLARSAVAPDSDLAFPVVGMSDVMPYPSTRYRDLGSVDLRRYRAVWSAALRRAAEAFSPDVVHVHHAWLVAALVKDVLPDVPVVVHCHGTCLRQLRLCPDLAGAVREGCARNELFAVLHAEQGREYAAELALAPDRFGVVGGGYRDDIFHPGGGAARPREPSLLYAGKLSRAKGVPFLVQAVRRLVAERPGLRLHVAGSGAGAEAEGVHAELASLAPAVVYHGRLAQEELAALMRRVSVFVLPSLYEGLALVLVEALASGCRVVATALPGTVEAFGRVAPDRLELVAPPRLRSIDEPLLEDVPRFVDDLAGALSRALAAPLPASPGDRVEELRPFTWRAVFERVERLWSLTMQGCRGAQERRMRPAT